MKFRYKATSGLKGLIMMVVSGGLTAFCFANVDKTVGIIFGLFFALVFLGSLVLVVDTIRRKVVLEVSEEHLIYGLRYPLANVTHVQLEETELIVNGWSRGYEYRVAVEFNDKPAMVIDVTDLDSPAQAVACAIRSGATRAKLVQSQATSIATMMQV